MDKTEAELLLNQCIRYCIDKVESQRPYNVKQLFTKLYSDLSIHLLATLERFYKTPLAINRTVQPCESIEELTVNILALVSLFILTSHFDHRLFKRINNRLIIANSHLNPMAQWEEM